MIILDTNVVSETMRRAPNRRLVGWLDEQPSAGLYLCAPVLAELYYGIARLEASPRKDELRRCVEDMVLQIFNGRVVPLDAVAAGVYGEIVAKQEAAGKPITVMDAIIAAIAKSNNATLATRNTADFELTGIALVNPFDDQNAP